MTFENEYRPSRDSEIDSLICLLARLERLDQWAASSIAVDCLGPKPSHWVPVRKHKEEGLANDLSLMLLDEATLQSKAKARIHLIDGETCGLNLTLERPTSHEEIEQALEVLLEWVSVHLDRSRVEIEIDGFELSAQKYTYDHFLSSPAAEKILTAGPSIGPREAIYTLEAAKNGWNEKHSTFLDAFELKFAGFVGTKYAMATSSCTGALHLALLAMGIGPGDEVIVPDTTWVATGAAIKYVGATPVFADVDPVTWTMTVQSVKDVMTTRTKAILPVHLYGYPADMPRLVEFSNKHGLSILEDAAPAIGALIEGTPVGSFGDMAAFSFQGAKMLVTGEGGMLVTSNSELRDRAWRQQDHGRRPGTFWIEEIGRKYKMSNLTAALGLAQLESAETQINQKRRINGWYHEFLDGVTDISFQTELPGSRSVCWMTSIRIEPGKVTRDGLAQHLKKDGIDTRPVFPPMSQFPIWGGRDNEVAGVTASDLGNNALNLPSGVNLSRASVERVADSIIKYISR